MEKQTKPIQITKSKLLAVEGKDEIRRRLKLAQRAPLPFSRLFIVNNF
ncbi:MAG: hypothetical protein MUF15_25290 [Acidobacteria bacterium]|nr:hypothetical protein [Acidobacteriota bacterium]